MNSDPHDSAAWRTFGMLDADESAIFDSAMRADPALRDAYLEMDRLSAAIAAATATPIEPKPGQLERLQNRLGLHGSKRAYLWLGISGWAAAAVLALLLVLESTGTQHHPAGDTASDATNKAAAPSSPTTPVDNIAPHNKNAAETPGQTTDPHDPALVAAPSDPDKPMDNTQLAKIENQRLITEIQVLRETLEKIQHRDRVLFKAMPGMALPIVMTMRPPGLNSEDSASIAKNDEPAAITAMLGDALNAMNSLATGEPSPGTAVIRASNPTSPTLTHPSAVPIYDAARDSGTLVVSNLPPAETGLVYNLWVSGDPEGQPTFVGSLPQRSAAGGDSFDFSLGSTSILPTGFLLTKDPQGTPASPSISNTVLEGPPTTPPD